MVTTAKTSAEQPDAQSRERESQNLAVDNLLAIREPIVLRLPSNWRLTDAALIQLFELNEMLPFERTAEGDLVIAPPPHGRSPEHGVEIAFQIRLWLAEHGDGVVRDASGGYKLGETPAAEAEDRQATLVPNVSWMPSDLIESMDSETYKDAIPTVCPPFVVEILSAKQSLPPQQRKMDQWIAFGVQLGWLFDPRRGKVWIYRAGDEEPEELERPDSLSGEEILKGFELVCAPIWE